MSAQDNLSPKQFRKGDRVTDKSGKRTGTIHEDEYLSFGRGYMAHVHWDDASKSDSRNRVMSKNLRAVNG